MSFLKSEELTRWLRNFYIITLRTLFKTVDSAIILIMTAVKNVSIVDLALVINKIVCDLNVYNLLKLTKAFKLYNDNLASKGKRYIKKIIEKFNRKFLMMMTYQRMLRNNSVRAY